MFCAYDTNAVIEMFKEYADYQSTPTDKEHIVDYFGVRVPVRYAKYLAGREGTKIEQPPYPDDTIRASFLEYLAIIESIRDCGNVYQMSEVGAAYGPFSAICARLALRKGASKVVLRPVEASLRGCESIHDNLFENNLLNSNVDMQLIHAAVVGTHKDVYFPDVDCTVDNGACAYDNITKLDVRGFELPMVKVRGIPFSFILESFPYSTPIDLLLIDIQGAEYYSLPLDIFSLTDRVKRVMLGTHSRLIEGKMMEVFHRSGWVLIAEEPCEIKYRRDLIGIEGMTIKDGLQYWVNQNLV